MYVEADRAVMMKPVLSHKAFFVGRSEQRRLTHSAGAAFSLGAHAACRAFPNMYPSLQGATSMMEEVRRHGARTASVACEIGFELGLTSRLIETLRVAATVHDVGKALINPPTLASADSLSAQAVVAMREHTRFGQQLIAESFKTDPMIAKEIGEVALYHHEHWDGFGYPHGLRGREIPLLARIVSVADVFDALVSARSYKSAWTTQRTVDEISAGRGTQFDPDCVDAFMRRVDEIVLAREQFGFGQAC
jgi:HD-GYP domain-containing protein (c-di-GMP phosphodiesterase class II)